MATTTTARIRRRVFAYRAIFSLILGGLALLSTMPSAEAAKPTTWIVIDAGNGQILSQNSPDALNYPASLTKMMTLFLTFEALEQHRISLGQSLPVSRHAAAQAPSKLGLRAGDTITVRELILSIVTHSANDSAVVLAEGLAGSEPAFATRMNRNARALGMTRTNFRNASGLPNPFQYTTARDLSKLSLALYRTFPKEYSYFGTESFTYNGATYGNHNHLMEAFEGMDGIKTGFINASGFNLAASAVRDHRRLIGVIMGGHSAESRDMEMAALLDDGFGHRSAGGQGRVTVAANTPIEPATPPPSAKIARPAAPPQQIAQEELPAPAAPKSLPRLRNGDGLSVISAAVLDEEPAPAPKAQKHVYRSAAVHHRRGKHRRVQVAHNRHRLRRGVELASAEQPAPSHHHRHVASAKHHHATEHRYASSHHHNRHYAANHRGGRGASGQRSASMHHQNRNVKSASAAKAAGAKQHKHGVACGGWNGSTKPCPPSQRGPRHDNVRDASIGATSRPPSS
jgi:D-alanyl-D-alanine carboxypeptidase